MALRNRKEFFREYYKKNKEKYRLKNRNWRLINGKTYYKKNKEKIFLSSRKWKLNNREVVNQYRKQYRHRNGISNKYNSELGISYTKEYKRFHRKKRKYLLKGGGILSIKTIQMVYEDNIKKYGTLTCYICEKNIDFGKDHLEHKIPLVRGGDNSYINLAISCPSCNLKKGRKTESEYREEVLKIMADTIQPVSKPVGKSDGMASPSGYSTITTPEPAFGHYFGSGKEGKDAKGNSSMMGKK